MAVVFHLFPRIVRQFKDLQISYVTTVAKNACFRKIRRSGRGYRGWAEGWKPLKSRLPEIV